MVAETDKMYKISHRTVIRYLCIKGLSSKEIHEDMVETLGENAPSFSRVKKWAAHLKHGRENLEDDSRPGRLRTVTTDETTGRIHDMIMEDRRLTEQYTATELDISKERVYAIIHNDL